MRKLRLSSRDTSRPCLGAAGRSAGRGGRGSFQVKVRPPETRGFCPAFLPRAWPCKLALTIPALPLSFSPFNPKPQREEEGWERAGPSQPGSPPLRPEPQVCLHSWGTSWSPHLGQKGTTRSSVYSGLSGSQQELFSSKMKRKQTLCQVNRRHCSQRWQGPFVGPACEVSGSLIQGESLLKWRLWLEGSGPQCVIYV